MTVQASKHRYVLYGRYFCLKHSPCFCSFPLTLDLFFPAFLPDGLDTALRSCLCFAVPVLARCAFKSFGSCLVFFAFFCLVTVLDAFPCIFMVLTSWSHPVWPRLLTLMWQCLYKAAFISHSQPLCVTEAESQTFWILIWLFTSWHI